jgi:hypothetical protein
MKIQHVLIGFLVLAALAAFLVFSGARSAKVGGERDPLIGTRLLPIETGLAASQIEFTKKEGGVAPLIIEKKGPDWVLPALQQLPVNFDRLREFFQKLGDGTYQRRVTDRPESLERMEFGTETILLKDSAGKTLWEMRIGKAPEGNSGGAYFQIGSDPKSPAYFTSESLFFDVEPVNWANRSPFDAEPKKIEQITVRLKDDKDSLVLTRKAEGEPLTADRTPGGKEVNQVAVSDLLVDILQQSFTKYLKTGDTEIAKANIDRGSVSLKPFGKDPIVIAFRQEETQPADKKDKGKDKAESPPAPEEPKGILFVWDRPDDQGGDVHLQYPPYTANHLPVTTQAFFKEVPPPTPPASAEGAPPPSDAPSAEASTPPIAVPAPPATPKPTVEATPEKAPAKQKKKPKSKNQD